METTIIDEGNLQYFKTLLLPETIRSLHAGTPVLALGAVDNGMACGALTGGPLDGSFLIDSLFVSPAHRGRGAGTALLNELTRLAAQQTKLRELRCAFTISCADHELLPPFLSRHGFIFEPVPNSVVSIPLGALAQLSFYKTTQTAVRVCALSELSDGLLRSLDRRLAAADGPLLDQPLDKAPLDRECSTVTVKGHAIDACLLLEKKDEKHISFVYADAGSAIGSGSVFSGLLITSYRQCLQKYAADTQVLIQPVTPLSQALVERLTPPETRKLSLSAVRRLH